MTDKCYRCGRQATDTHHIFNGALRKKSEEYGATIRVCRGCHNYIHSNATYRLYLKAKFQARIMEEFKMSTDEFIQVFYKNYIEEGENDED